jgi:hypothetical protein
MFFKELFNNKKKLFSVSAYLVEYRMQTLQRQQMRRLAQDRLDSESFYKLMAEWSKTPIISYEEFSAKYDYK